MAHFVTSRNTARASRNGFRIWTDMRLLILASCHPWPPNNGRRIRMYNLYGPLARKHEICWVMPKSAGTERRLRETQRMFERVVEVAVRSGTTDEQGQATGLLRSMGNVMEGYVRGPFAVHEHEEVFQALPVLLEDGFDAVVVEHEEMAAYVRVSTPGVPWILNTQNAPSIVARRTWQITNGVKSRLRAWVEYRSALRFEQNLFPRFFAVTVVSELERQRLVRRFRGIRAQVIPNGVDSGLLSRHVSAAIDERLLNFTGNFGYPPNQDAMRYFCASVLPLILQRDNRVRLEMVGRGSREFAASLPSALPVTGLGSADDPSAHIVRAAAVIAPLRVGGGTRIKVLEAAALGKPVIATSVGAEGINLDESCGLLIADDPLDFAEKTLAALSDPGIRDAAQRSGRARIMADYLWESASRKMAELIDLAVAPGAGNR